MFLNILKNNYVTNYVAVEIGKLTVERLEIAQVLFSFAN